MIDMNRVRELFVEKTVAHGKKLFATVEREQELVDGMSRALGAYMKDRASSPTLDGLFGILAASEESLVAPAVDEEAAPIPKAWYMAKKKAAIEMCGEVTGEIAGETLSKNGMKDADAAPLVAMFAGSAAHVMSQPDRLGEVHFLMGMDGVGAREYVRKKLTKYVSDAALVAMRIHGTPNMRPAAN